MRSKKELYEIVLNEFRYTNGMFICNTIENLFLQEQIISKEECDFILNDFHSNYPSTSQHSEFMIEGLFNHENEYGSWWRLNKDESNSIRITFLEKLVRLNS